MLNKFEQVYERHPSIDEIAEKVDIPEDKIIDAMQMNKRQISVDAPLADSDNTSYIDILPNNLSTNTDNNLVLQSLRDEIACAHNALNKREKNVIKAYIGINQPE